MKIAKGIKERADTLANKAIDIWQYPDKLNKKTKK